MTQSVNAYEHSASYKIFVIIKNKFPQGSLLIYERLPTELVLVKIVPRTGVRHLNRRTRCPRTYKSSEGVLVQGLTRGSFVELKRIRFLPSKETKEKV